MRTPHAVLAVVAALLLAALAGVCFVGGEVAPMAALDRGDEAAAGRAASAPERGAGGAPSRERVAAPAPRCSGRCVDWRTGEALAGCRVTIEGAGGAVTDRSGAFAIDISCAPEGAVVEVASRGHLTVRRALAGAPSGALGDVRLRAATTLRGVVLDADGRPCAEVDVLADPQRQVARVDGWSERFELRARTDGHGVFAFAAPLPVGALRLDVPDLVAVGGDTRVQLAADAPAFVELRCRAWTDDEVIVGRVESHDGAPVAEAVVIAAGESITVGAARSDETGRFRLLRRDGAPDVVTLAVHDLRDADGRRGRREGVRWGQRDVLVRLDAPAGAIVEVVAADTGEAIEDYALQCVALGALRSSSSGARRLAGRHQRGRCALPDVAGGLHQLIVWPSDARWLPNLPQAFCAEANGRTLVRVELQRAMPCPVQVVDERGAPVVGATVELLRPADNDVVRDHARLFDHGGSAAALNVRLAAARSDARGVASLRWFADPEPLQLRVHGDGIGARRVHGVRLGEGVVRVHVERAGVVALRLRGAEGHRVALRACDGDDVVPAAWQPVVVLDARGEAELQVPAGRWSVRLHAVVDGLSFALPAPDAASPLANVEVEAGARVTLSADASGLTARAFLRGVALLDGAPAPRVSLQFGERLAGDVRWVALADAVVDARGAFAFDGLPAGAFRVCVQVPCGGRSVAVPQQGPLSLAAGEQRAGLTLSVTTAPVRLRLRSADDASPAAGRLDLRSSSGVVLVASPASGGEVTFDRVPLGSYRVQWCSADRVVDLGALEVPPGGVPERTFELP